VEVVNAKKIRWGRADALKLAKSAAKVVVTRGQSVVTFDMKTPPGDAELLNAILGPTGNLRAPTMRVGKTLLVGFNAESHHGYFE
jgi:hypothetical protein